MNQKLIISLIFLIAFGSFAQSDNKQIIDSLKSIIQSDVHDTIRIDAYYTWDELIYIENPELDREINEAVVEIADKHLSGSNINTQEALYFYRSKAKSENILGLLLIDYGDYFQAQDHFFTSLKIAKALNDSIAMATATSNLGMIYKIQEDPEKSLEYYEKSMQLDEKTPANMSIYYNNIGLCYTHMHKDKLALECYKKSLKLSRKANHLISEANTLGNIGEIYMNYEEYDTAIYYFKKSIALHDSLGNESGHGFFLSRLGMIYNRLNKFDTGIKHCLKALSIVEKNKSLHNELQCYKCLYYGFKGKGNSSKALHYFEKFEATEDSLFKREKRDDLLNAEYQYKYEAKRIADSLQISNQQKIKEFELQADIERKQDEQKVLYAGLFVLLLLGGIVFRSYRLKKKDNKIIAAQKNEVEEQKELIEVKNNEILDSITYAKRIQEAILPPNKLISDHLPNSFIYYQPKDIVAGDFYWLESYAKVTSNSKTSSESNETLNKTIFAVADCTGHGVPGAMVSVVCNNALNRSVREFGLTKPSDILNKTRALVIETFEKSEKEVKDGMDIALVSISEMKDDTSVIQFSGANNPLWIKRKGESKIEEIKGDKQPIGKFAKEVDFTSHTIELKKGDLIYLFTDGFADQFGGPKGKKYKYKQLKSMLISISELPMNEQKEKIALAFNDWKGELEQLDDVCIMGVRF